MTTYIALLRAINVGRTGKLPMSDLKAMCAELSFRHIETYIASGNVVFDCAWPADKVQTQLEKKLHHHAGKSIGVFVRSAAEMRTVLERNPFADKEPRLLPVRHGAIQVTDSGCEPGQREEPQHRGQTRRDEQTELTPGSKRAIRAH
jgi:uncharacterized protein (DUF1697 family)